MMALTILLLVRRIMQMEVEAVEAGFAFASGEETKIECILARCSRNRCCCCCCSNLIQNLIQNLTLTPTRTQNLNWVTPARSSDVNQVKCSSP